MEARARAAKPSRRRPEKWATARRLALMTAVALPGCGEFTGEQSPASERAARRAYDGAPPVVAHESFGASCTNCHDAAGMPVEDVGFAPASPHDGTAQAYSTERCRQCHVFKTTDDLFVESSFVGLPQDLRPGVRLSEISPPTIPHRIFMRENCQACHTGPGARAEIATSHPERARCAQCHVPVLTQDDFTSALGAGLVDEDGQ